jgi:predicted ATPase/class 3 adenylate cyclase
MTDLVGEFQSLPAEYQNVLRLAQQRHAIQITPLQTLAGGWSGAQVYLVSVLAQNPPRVAHCVLKLDRKNEHTTSDETQRHADAVRLSPPAFAAEHLAQMAYEPVEVGGVLAIFYAIAGQSLHRYRTLAAYERQSQIETIFAHTYDYVLSAWNAGRTFRQAVQPTDLLKEWLAFRLRPGNQIEKFFETVLNLPPGLGGFLIQGDIFPNPLAYALHPEWWGSARPLDAAIGLQHGDLNTGNILVKFAPDEQTLQGYYLIDFALFREQQPLLLDLRYLEMSYLILRQAQVSLPKLVDLLVRLGRADRLEPQQLPVDVAGVGALIGSTRRVFDEWVKAQHPSLHDDLWGQYWLAGVAAGLAYCHKAPIAPAERLTGLIYAAANLKRYADLFGLPAPAEGRQLYDNLARFGRDQRPEAAAGLAAGPLPAGEVALLFTDIEGSTPLWESQPEQMRAALELHNTTVLAAVAAHSGQVFRTVGDAFDVAFSQPAKALAAAIEAQRQLEAAPWGALGPLKVRMGLHLGSVELKGGDYVSSHTFNRVARIMSAGHGGQILISAEVMEKLQGQLPSGVTLRDMGQHRLKGMARPEHLYQVLAPGLPADFPKLATLSATPNNLPVQLTPFIGRETELASLKALLADSRHRLLTLAAPGGMGKTRLALEAAEQSYAAYPHGVYFVALDRISPTEQDAAVAAAVAVAVAEVLPISLASQEEPKARILDYLRDKQVLLVMDNCEHVLDGALLVAELLAAAPRVQVLATSRVRLNLSGETVVTLQGLSIDEPALEQNSAVQLFAQSAQRTQPGFELAAGVLPAVARVCRLVEGMPLAIVLAAAWLDTLSVDEVAAEIEKSLDILETDKRDVAARQRSVRAVIASSWNQVDAAAQDLLKRLSVFRGGLTRAAAQQAAGATLRSLAQLVDKALLRRDPDSGRYHLHELLRQYAEEQLAQSAERERQAHQAHAQYFADFVAASYALLQDERQPAALAEIEADLDNIRLAVAYWGDQQSAANLLKFADALEAYFEISGAFTPAIQLFGGAIEKLSSNAPEVIWARAELQLRQAWFIALIGQADQGLRLAQASAATLQQMRPDDVSVFALNGVNINAIFLNDFPVVIQTSQVMLARAERTGDSWERGWALTWQAYALLGQQQVPAAMQAAHESLAIFEQRRNPWGVAVSAGLIVGAIAMTAGDVNIARANFLRGEQAAEQIHYLRMLQIASDNLGTLALQGGDLDQAHQYFMKSLRISQDCGQTREMLASLRDLASVALAQGDLAGALELLVVVLNHPASDQNSLNRPERLRDEAEKLRAQIQQRLEPSAYHAAWASGQSRPLAGVVAGILG